MVLLSADADAELGTTKAAARVPDGAAELGQSCNS
jgi:hypothetical protein